MIPNFIVTSGLLAFIVILCSSQQVVVPSECTAGFSAGTDEVLYTIPYTYDQVSHG